jgi:hypothetical protein
MMQTYFLIRATNGEYFKTPEEANFLAPNYEPYSRVFVTEEVDNCSGGAEHYIIKVWNSEKKEILIEEWEYDSHTMSL